MSTVAGFVIAKCLSRTEGVTEQIGIWFGY